ncbi:MAG: photosynthetic complex putative assembly protein PuhB [Pseudomonadota bacterium]
MNHDDFQGPEPVEGLPEAPPEGEKILWQGRPNWWALARDALIVRWVAAYFLLLGLWRGWAAWDRADLALGIDAFSVLAAMGALTCAILLICAYVMARATVYTITNKRVAMRVGAALTVTLNLPYRWIGAADLALNNDGTGTIALTLIGDTRFSYLVLWPHARPWRMSNTQPALRAIPDAEKVAALLAAHAQASVTRGPIRDAQTIAAE